MSAHDAEMSRRWETDARQNGAPQRITFRGPTKLTDGQEVTTAALGPEDWPENRYAPHLFLEVRK
jgi:hypothetical protein